MISKTEQTLRDKLEVLRRDQRQAAQFFYTSLVMHNTASQTKAIVDALNRSPRYWNTVLGSLEMSFFITLNRIFDNTGRHNIHSLLTFIRANRLQLFSPHALCARKMEGVQESANPERPTWLSTYIQKATYPDDLFFSKLDRYVGKYMKIYVKNYARVRHEVHAHNVTVDHVEVSKLYQQTNIRVVARLLTFVESVYEYIWQMMWNGRLVPLRLCRPSRVIPRILDSTLPSAGRIEDRIAAETRLVMESIK